MEPNPKPSKKDDVSYYNKDFDWKELQAKYGDYLKSEISPLSIEENETNSNYSSEWETVYLQNNDNFF